MVKSLSLNIAYDINLDEFKTSGDLNEKGRREIVSEFLRRQQGAGEDIREHEKRDVYHIHLNWFPEDDRIESSSDTENRALRDGILMLYLKRL